MSEAVTEVSAGGAARVRTVLGDVDPAELGAVDYHEHLFHASPLLPGDDLDDEDASRAEAADVHAAGLGTLVDATPVGLGRRPAALARISAATGLRIVASTGAHRGAHYPAGHWVLDADEDALARTFVADIEHGLEREHDAPARGSTPEVPSPGPRAGLIKTGIEYWRIGPFEARVLAAAGRAHVATGAPVMVHLERCSAAFEVLDVLAGHGVAAGRVALAHVDRNPDPVLHAELAAAGAYLGYDGWSRHEQWPDTTLLACLVGAVERGAGERILVGGDVARRARFLAYGGLPGVAYLPRRVFPRLRDALGDDPADRIIRTNPARWLTVAQT